MNASAMPPALQQLLDKQAITEVLHRYSRGVDRCDRATMATVYWPDAEDDHMVFKGGGQALLDYLYNAVLHMRTAHRISNILIEFDDADTARCESYVWAYHNMAVGETAGGATAGGEAREDVIFGGRYVDRFTRRAGEWRIAKRQVVMDYFQRLPASTDLGVFGTLQFTGGHYPADPIYDR